jgi:hypothetical protein
MTDDLVAMLKKDFSLDMKHEYPQTCLTEYEYERQKASDRIEKLEAALREIIVHCEVPAPPNAEALIMFARKALEGKVE